MAFNRLTVFLALISSNSAFSGVAIPKNYSMKCWDRTFFYNRVDIREEKNRMIIESSSQDLAVYRNLLKLPASAQWGQAVVSLSVPSENCHVAESDSKIIACKSEKLLLDIKGQTSQGQEINRKREIVNAIVQIRKIEELSVWGINTSGYELAILDNQNQTSPVLVQRYFYGLSEKETDNCTLENTISVLIGG
jgi:hypothetical protein